MPGASLHDWDMSSGRNRAARSTRASASRQVARLNGSLPLGITAGDENTDQFRFTVYIKMATQSIAQLFTEA